MTIDHPIKYEHQYLSCADVDTESYNPIMPAIIVKAKYRGGGVVDSFHRARHHISMTELGVPVAVCTNEYVETRN